TPWISQPKITNGFKRSSSHPSMHSPPCRHRFHTQLRPHPFRTRVLWSPKSRINPSSLFQMLISSTLSLEPRCTLRCRIRIFQERAKGYCENSYNTKGNLNTRL